MNMTGQYLKRRREDCGFSKCAVAQETGIATNQLRRIEKGKQFPAPETLMRLARYYELTPPMRHALLRCIDHDLLKPYRTPLNQMQGGRP